MPVRLRGHHLLCVLSHRNEGYSPRFVVNFGRLLDRLSAGEELEIVEGADDICAPLLASPGDHHCVRAHIGERDARAVAAVSELLGVTLAPGNRLVLDADTVRLLRDGFARGALRRACEGCEWGGLCADIAEAGFAGTRLQPVV